MAFWKDYLEYIRDNPNNYWFKRKPFGWGWTPVKWQGWLTILVFIFAIFLNFLSVEKDSVSDTDVLNIFLPRLVFLVLLLILVCYKKGERPGWQWGFRRKEDIVDN
ncbi:hypothetical protein H6775_01350 [Candidatus Nomurabacteria bacterium]|nr:hypothetical protein [Candidatus Nomurabacteria bacterium]